MLSYAVSVLGPERIVYGSDAPGRDMAVQLAKVTSAPLSSEASALILGSNAQRLYARLVVPTGPDPLLNAGDSDSEGQIRHREAVIDRSGGERRRIPFVDTSCFLGPWPFRTVPMTEAASLEAGLRAAGVTHAWVSPLAAMTQPSPGPTNQALLDDVGDNPFFSLVPVLNPLRRGLAELDQWVAAGARAVRLLPGPHGYDLVVADDLIAAATARGILIMVQVRMRDRRVCHPSFIPPEPLVDEILDVVRAHPTARIIVAGANAGEIRQLLASDVRLRCETSFAETQDTLRHLVVDVGAERLLSGTHAPILVPEAMAGRLGDVELSASSLP